MIMIIVIAGMAIMAWLFWLGLRERRAATEELHQINEETLDELEACTGKKWREAYQNWEKARSLIRAMLF